MVSLTTRPGSNFRNLTILGLFFGWCQSIGGGGGAGGPKILNLFSKQTTNIQNVLRRLI